MFRVEKALLDVKIPENLISLWIKPSGKDGCLATRDGSSTVVSESQYPRQALSAAAVPVRRSDAYSFLTHLHSHAYTYTQTCTLNLYTYLKIK